MLPLYEAKMVGAYDHRAADVVKSATALKRQNQPSYLTDNEHRDPARLAMPASWVGQEYVPATNKTCRLGFLRISSPTNARTLIAALLPITAVGDSVFLIESEDEVDMCLLTAQMNSFALDYVVRQKLAGLNLNFFYVRQFPILSPTLFEAPAPWNLNEPLDEWIVNRVLALTLSANDMEPLADSLGATVRPWHEPTRSMVSAELDAGLFHLFEYSRVEIEYVMDTFSIVRRKDESIYGSYRTKELILKVYDAMQAAIETGGAYRSPFEWEQP